MIILRWQYFWSPKFQVMKTADKRCEWHEHIQWWIKVVSYSCCECGASLIQIQMLNIENINKIDQLIY